MVDERSCRERESVEGMSSEVSREGSRVIFRLTEGIREDPGFSFEGGRVGDGDGDLQLRGGKEREGKSTRSALPLSRTSSSKLDLV